MWIVFYFVAMAIVCECVCVPYHGQHLSFLFEVGKFQFKTKFKIYFYIYVLLLNRFSVTIQPTNILILCGFSKSPISTLLPIPGGFIFLQMTEKYLAFFFVIAPTMQMQNANENNELGTFVVIHTDASMYECTYQIVRVCLCVYRIYVFILYGYHHFYYFYLFCYFSVSIFLLFSVFGKNLPIKMPKMGSFSLLFVVL